MNAREAREVSFSAIEAKAAAAHAAARAEAERVAEQDTARRLEGERHAVEKLPTALSSVNLAARAGEREASVGLREHSARPGLSAFEQGYMERLALLLREEGFKTCLEELVMPGPTYGANLRISW